MNTRFFSGAAASIWMAVVFVLNLSPLQAESVSPLRLALLISNANYKESNVPLATPLKSGQMLAAELRRNGFDVELDENLGKDAFQKVLDSFLTRVKPGATVLLFFSGYGIQSSSSAYLIPVDAQIWSEADVKRTSIGLPVILTQLEDRGAKPKFVILDASRRNPFERRFRSFSLGLGKIDASDGTLILSAAAPGAVIDDGESENSLFVGELLKEMRAPDLSAEEMFKRTRLGVSQASNGEQVPWMTGTLPEDTRVAPTVSKPKTVSPGQAAATAAPARIGIRPEQIEPGVSFRDCTECPELIVVPAGSFDMGSTEFAIEKPVHHVMIDKPFAIGRYEVTFSQWDACVAEHGCGFSPDDHGRGRTNLPISDVSWDDAESYVAWLSQTTGYKYRLPSEAEWEYAARGATTTPVWWGEGDAAGQANCHECGPGAGEETMPVGSFPANGFGLADTAGNVAEWVEDCWTDSYRKASKDGSPQVSAACKHRVLRGGSFDSSLRYLRSSSRFLYDASVRYYTNGFRVLRELP